MRVDLCVDAGVDGQGDFLEEADAAEGGHGDAEWYGVDFGGGGQAAGEGLGGGEGGGEEEGEEEGKRLG